MDKRPYEILLVEDDPAHAVIVSESFRSAADRFHVTPVRTLKEATNQLRENTPDLIITDWMLPDGKGSDLLPEGADVTGGPPVVLITSHGSEDLAVEAMKAGALDYVVKSQTGFRELIHVAERALREWDHIVNRRLAETELRRVNELLEKAFATIHIQIVYLDTSFRIVRVNRAFAATARKDTEFFVGKAYLDLFPDDETEAIFRRVLETGDPHFLFAKPVNTSAYPHMESRYWDWILQPIQEPSGEVSGLLVSVIDVSERERAIRRQGGGA